MSSRAAYDPDLYKRPDEEETLTVTINGRDFTVVEFTVDPATGLDALVLQNPDTREITVAFQGTNGSTDVATDGMLVTAVTPSQYAAAVAYVADVAGRHGRVDSVCGNSLGGGLAAYVALLDPSIQAVTVNPAPVPAHVSGLKARNITNYISTLDPLYRALSAGRLTDRIAGRIEWFEGGSAQLRFAVEHHIGSDREASPYNASMAVPFSLFHQDLVVGAGGFGGRIRVTGDALVLMARGLGAQRENLLEVSRSELDRAGERLASYRAQIPVREEKCRRQFQEQAVEWYAPVRELIGRLAAGVEESVRRAWLRLPVPPVARPVCGWLLAEVGDQITRLVAQVQQAGDVSVEAAADWAWQRDRDLFRLGSQEITDGLVVELGQFERGRALADRKWVTFQKMTLSAHAALTAADAQVAADIAAGRAPSAPVPLRAAPSWPAGAVSRIEESVAKRGLQQIVDRRQEIAGDLVGTLGTGLATGLMLALEAALTQSLLAIIALENACTQVTVALNVASYSPALLVGAAVTGNGDDLAEFRRAFNRTAGDILGELGDARSRIWQVQDVLAQLPVLVRAFADYLEASLFADTEIESAYHALLKVRSLTDRSELSFAEVGHQLGDHQAELIDALADRAGDLRTDLATMSANVTEMVT
ncbi:hypothetical protein [Cellulomonas denverensis]|uniref:Fungal lipase-like domain-containing protein n=1 Tax=Cellulomonas denverensis TaxID=264297 RepID=A0A7X6KUM4_9CELL|nr:hypothetical protein [Cellulomonas denverensis]NKY22591.1 hypothetical protein [Cellulomonas denverensis]